MTTVTLEGGKLELPSSVRLQLGLSDGDRLELEITDQSIVLRPIDSLTTEEEDLVRRARADVQAGRVRRMSEEDLLRLIQQS